jgi:hypothetical protein
MLLRTVMALPRAVSSATIPTRRRNRVYKPDPSKEGPVSKETGLLFWKNVPPTGKSSRREESLTGKDWR